MTSHPRHLTAAALVEVARIHPAAALGHGYHQSHPVPVVLDGTLKVAFLYCEASILAPGQGLILSPPTYVAVLNAESATLEELRALVPGESGGPTADAAPIGACRTPAERMEPEFVGQQARLYQAYDFLLGPFAAGDRDPVRQVSMAANTFQKVFPELSEAPLAPWYAALGGAFFDWVSLVARAAPG